MSSLRKQGSRLKNLDFKDFFIISFRFLNIKALKYWIPAFAGMTLTAFQEPCNKASMQE